MNARQNRLRTITTLLNALVITSQDQLIEALQMQGYDITQATLSRDLRELRAEKKVLPNGGFKYIIPANPQVQKHVLGMDSDVINLSIKSIDFCGQFAVVKTKPGYANAVAYDIDERGSHLILGTIAGDDTILIIPRETTTREQLYDFLYGIE